MGRRPARHRDPARRRALRRALVLLLLVAGCGGASTPPPRPPDLGPLDAAVAAVSDTRGAVLASVDAVMRAAGAVDDTDAACRTGEGVAARTALRTAQPLAKTAREALTALPARVRSYQDALAGLGREAPALPSAQAALAAVVTGGRAEATAVLAYRSAAAGAWPAYDRLLQLEDTWVTRAVTPWYRDAKEGSAAYTVLVDGDTAALARARSALAAASSVVRGPSAAQSATLAAADRALG